MAKYRPTAPAYTPPRKARTTRPTPHRTHLTWDLTCESCQHEMHHRMLKAASVNARTMTTAPGYGR